MATWKIVMTDEVSFTRERIEREGREPIEDTVIVEDSNILRAFSKARQEFARRHNIMDLSPWKSIVSYERIDTKGNR